MAPKAWGLRLAPPISPPSMSGSARSGGGVFGGDTAPVQDEQAVRRLRGDQPAGVGTDLGAHLLGLLGGGGAAGPDRPDRLVGDHHPGPSAAASSPPSAASSWRPQTCVGGPGIALLEELADGEDDPQRRVREHVAQLATRLFIGLPEDVAALGVADEDELAQVASILGEISPV